ncbi:hypothetical protein Droror1_Dr00017132 [Drosera rotundifolia]
MVGRCEMDRDTWAAACVLGDGYVGYCLCLALDGVRWEFNISYVDHHTTTIIKFAEATVAATHQSTQNHHTAVACLIFATRRDVGRCPETETRAEEPLPTVAARCRRRRPRTLPTVQRREKIRPRRLAASIAPPMSCTDANEGGGRESEARSEKSEARGVEFGRRCRGVAEDEEF